MKKIFILLIGFVFYDCSHITENVIENNFPDDALEVGVKNNTPYLFKRTEISNDGHTYVYQQIAPNQLSEFKSFNKVYSDVEIRIETDHMIFHKSPNVYNEESLVTTGDYYFEISLTSNGQDIIVTRKSF